MVYKGRLNLIVRRTVYCFLPPRIRTYC